MFPAGAKLQQVRSCVSASNKNVLLQIFRQLIRQKATMSQETLHSNLWDTDPELFDLIKKEKRRQKSGLEMIASENFTSLPVLQCLSSCLHNKYSEGLPGQR